MGTDIHLSLEARDLDTGVWHQIPGIPRWDRSQPPNPDPSARDYLTFAFLAGVRNGFGFAGVHTHEPLTPLFEGRGLPKDMDGDGLVYPGSSCFDENDDIGAHIYLGDHSFTWATLVELRAAPWDALVKATGVVGRNVYEAWFADGANGPPDNWCGGTWGPNVETWSQEKYERYMNREQGTPLEFPPGVDVYIKIEWTYSPLMERSFYRWLQSDDVTDMIRTYGPNVRLIMGFDS